MVWTAPITFLDDDPLTASIMNSHVRDNFLETGPGKATTASRLLTTAGTNNIGERQWGTALVRSTISVSEFFPTLENNIGDLYGPKVTVEHGGRVWVAWNSFIRVPTGSNAGSAVVGPVFNGDERASLTRQCSRSGREGGMAASASTTYYGEPGLLTVALGYGVSKAGDAAEFAERRLTVIPF